MMTAWVRRDNVDKWRNSTQALRAERVQLDHEKEQAQQREAAAAAGDPAAAAAAGAATIVPLPTVDIEAESKAITDKLTAMREQHSALAEQQRETHESTMDHLKVELQRVEEVTLPPEAFDLSVLTEAELKEMEQRHQQRLEIEKQIRIQEERYQEMQRQKEATELEATRRLVEQEVKNLERTYAQQTRLRDKGRRMDAKAHDVKQQAEAVLTSLVAMVEGTTDLPRLFVIQERQVPLCRPPAPLRAFPALACCAPPTRTEHRLVFLCAFDGSPCRCGPDPSRNGYLIDDASAVARVLPALRFSLLLLRQADRVQRLVTGVSASELAKDFGVNVGALRKRANDAEKVAAAALQRVEAAEQLTSLVTNDLADEESLRKAAIELVRTDGSETEADIGGGVAAVTGSEMAGEGVAAVVDEIDLSPGATDDDALHRYLDRRLVTAHAEIDRLESDLAQGTSTADQPTIQRLTGAAYAVLKRFLGQRGLETLEMRRETDRGGVVDWVRPDNAIAWRCTTADERRELAEENSLVTFLLDRCHVQTAADAWALVGEARTVGLNSIAKLAAAPAGSAGGLTPFVPQAQAWALARCTSPEQVHPPRPESMEPQKPPRPQSAQPAKPPRPASLGSVS